MKLLVLVLAITTVSYGAKSSSLKGYLDMGFYTFQEEEGFAAPAPETAGEAAAAGEAGAAGEAAVTEEAAPAGESVTAEESAPEPPVLEAPVYEAPANEASVGEATYIPSAPEAPVYEASAGEATYIPSPAEEAPVAIEAQPLYAEAPTAEAYAGEPVAAEPTFGERLDQQIYTTTAAPEAAAVEEQSAAQALNDRANDPQVRAYIDLGIQVLLEATRNADGVPADVSYTFESLDNLVDLENAHELAITLTDGADRRVYGTFSVVDENGQPRVTNGCVRAGKFIRV